MATIFDEHNSLWDSSIDVTTVFADLFDGNHIIPPCIFQDDWFIAYRLCALDVSQSYCIGGVGTICIILVNGNNIFSQITLLIGFGAVAYRIEGNALNASLGINDVDTIYIVDVDGVPTAVEGRHRAPIIHRFRAKKK
jgi:hypothetical protein